MSAPMNTPSLADLLAQHSRCDDDYNRALDEGDAARMIAARRRKEDVADELRVARLLEARDAVGAAETELHDAHAAAAGYDAAAAAALEARDEAYRLFETKAAALNAVEMDRMFARNRIEGARRAQEAARARLAALTRGLS